MVRVLVVLMILAVAPDAFAECYMLIGYGQAKVNEHRLKTRNFEDKLIGLPLVDGAIKKNGESNPYTFGGGCQVFRYLWLELTYRDHFSAEVHSSYWIEGFGRRSESVNVVRSLEVHGPALAGVFEIPLHRPVSLIGKIGAMKGTGYMSIVIPEVSTEYMITKKEERILPVGGIGLLLRATKHISIAVEHEQFNRDFRYTSVNLRYRF